MLPTGGSGGYVDFGSYPLTYRADPSPWPVAPVAPAAAAAPVAAPAASAPVSLSDRLRNVAEVWNPRAAPDSIAPPTSRADVLREAAAGRPPTVRASWYRHPLALLAGAALALVLLFALFRGR